jgi:hypothetical protein
MSETKIVLSEKVQALLWLQHLSDSEINWTISSFFDAGYSAFLGDNVNGIKASSRTFDTIEEAVRWLCGKACEYYPNSDFARERRRFT